MGKPPWTPTFLSPYTGPRLPLEGLFPAEALTQLLSPQRLQVPQAQAALQTLAATPRKQAHERKSSLKRAFSLRKSGSGAPRGARPAHSPSAEARPPRRPGFLPLCMGGHRPSIPSSPGEQACRSPWLELASCMFVMVPEPQKGGLGRKGQIAMALLFMVSDPSSQQSHLRTPGPRPLPGTCVHERAGAGEMGAWGSRPYFLHFPPLHVSVPLTIKEDISHCACV